MPARSEYSSLRQGLVVAWCASLGASGRVLIDRSGRNNNGTLTNLAATTPWSTAGGGGLSLAFPGASSPSLPRFVSARVNDNAYLLGSFTASVWARYSGAVTANFPAFLSHSGATDNGQGFTIGPNISTAAVNPNAVYVFISDGTNGAGFQSAIAGNNSIWNHYVLVRNVGSLSMFTNGVLLGSVSTTAVTGSLTSNLPAVMGIRPDGLGFGFAANTFLGNLDDARIYSRVLTASEIKLLASRRGIGLPTLPDRAAGLPRKFRVRVGGSHEQADAYTKVGGVWRLAEASVNDAGVWK